MENKAQVANKFSTNTVRLVIAGIFLVIAFFASTKLFENVGAGEIVIIQSPVSGNLEMYNTPGVKWQGFGTVTRYKKSFQYWFSKAKDEGTKDDQSIRIGFNDGGHAQLSGSCRIDLPTDKHNMLLLHTRYNSQEGIEKTLVRTVIEKSVYMTGPLMSSKESFAAKKTDLINFIADQAEHGVYKTRQKEIKEKDPISGEEKTVTIVEIQKDQSGVPATQEVSPLQIYHLGFGNLSINALDYDKPVADQINAQQKLVMEVQTAIATSKKAEQEALTTAKQGEANAVKAKWDQEAIKARVVTEAQQNLEVQKLSTQQAALYKQQQILEGEGDAEKKRLMFSANGALDVKLEAWTKVNLAYAAEMGKQRWVPDFYMGGGSGNGGVATGSAFSDFMNLTAARTAKEIGLDMSQTKK